MKILKVTSWLPDELSSHSICCSTFRWAKVVSGSVAFDLRPCWKLIWRISGHIAPQVEWLPFTDFKASTHDRLLPCERHHFLLCGWCKPWFVCQREEIGFINTSTDQRQKQPAFILDAYGRIIQYFGTIWQIYVHVLRIETAIEESWDFGLYV